MPTPNPTTRREYKGAAAGTSLTSPMGNADTSFVLVSNTNWPTGAVGNFIVCINRGQPDEEKILCATQSAKTVTAATSGRGFDGTTAQAHAAGATVECVISAFDADEWNQHTNASTAVHGVATVAGLTETQTFTNKTLTSPTVNGATLDAASTIGGISGTTLAADRTDWAAWTPSWTNLTVGNGVVTAFFKQLGKTVFFNLAFTAGSTSSVAAAVSVTLPVNAQDNAYLPVYAQTTNGLNYQGLAQLSGGGGISQILVPSSNTTESLVAWSGPVAGVAFGTSARIAISGSYRSV